MPLKAVAKASVPSKPRFVRQLPEQRRQALIAATIECLKRYGHEGLSIRTISAQAGVSVGLINHHFPNKDELMAAAYRHFNSELVAAFTSAVARAPGEPAGAPARVLRGAVLPPNLDQDVLTVWVVFWGMYRHSRLIQRVHRETYQGYVQLVRGMLSDPHQAGRGARARHRPAPRRHRPERAPRRAVARVVPRAGQLPAAPRRWRCARTGWTTCCRRNDRPALE